MLFLISGSCLLLLGWWEKVISGNVLLKIGAGWCGNVAKWQLKIPRVHVALLVTTRLKWYKYKSTAGLLAQPISFHRCVICVSLCTRVCACVCALHTKRVIAFDGGYRSLSHICSGSVRHFKSFWSSLIAKGHVVNKHCCPTALLGPSETLIGWTGYWLTHLGSSSPAAVIQSGPCTSRWWWGGRRRKKK